MIALWRRHGFQAILITGLVIMLGLFAWACYSPAHAQERIAPKCVKYDSVGLNLSKRLESPYQELFLTKEALHSGIRVYITTSEENKYGSVSIMYWQPSGECVVWFETITVQEYALRLGLTPYGISPFFKKED